jgi:FkbM family methyltransferase
MSLAPTQNMAGCAMDLAGRHPVDVVLDVGAHHGEMSARFAARWPTAQIHAFEPDERNHERLARRFADQPDVTLHKVALSDQTGTQDFHIGDFDATSSLYRRESVERRYWRADFDLPETVRVPTLRLDDWVATQGISRIDLLKLDTQGAEKAILTGAAGLLDRQAIGVILTEFFAVPHYAGAPLLPEIWALMMTHGYSLFDLRIDAHGLDGQARYGDAIFLSPNRRAALDRQTGPEP